MSLGGEKFILLLPQTGIEGAQIMAERLRSIIENWDFPIPSKIISSLGVSQYHSSDNAKTLIKRVDEAFYRTKEAGHNRVSTLLPL